VQARQKVAPAEEVMLIPHTKHELLLEAPAEAEKVPAGQVEQAVDFKSGENVPAGQILQELFVSEPKAVEYEPAGHERQVEELSVVENVPAKQELHTEDEVAD
jgi:hypothetical protein